MDLKLEWDVSQIEALRSQGLERALVRAVSKAGGDAIRAARVASSRTVRFRKRMKVGRVNESLKLVYPRGGSSRSGLDLGSLVWRVDVSGQHFTVGSFPYRAPPPGRGKGVSVAINKGKRKLIPHAFEAKMKSGHVGIFGRETRGKGSKRLPIRELFTTRIPDLFADSGMVPAVHAKAQAVFSKSFARLLPLELAKAGAK